MSSYLEDILAQPAALRDLLLHFQPAILEDTRSRMLSGDFNCIQLSGMGSSYFATYPALLQLCRMGIPVTRTDTAELLHSQSSTITPRTLLWLNSQSGRSAEIVHLLDALQRQPPARTLGFANDETSPLATRSDVAVLIHAGGEATVSTKTYINMLAANLLAAIILSGDALEPALEQFSAAAQGMQSYLDGYRRRLEALDGMLGEFNQLFILGRGSSLSAVWNGALILKEAAKCAFEGMHAAFFRHGPLELVEPGFVAIVFAGASSTAGLNRSLAQEIVALGGKALWVAAAPDPELPTLLLPQTAALARPLVEILPLQLLTLVMARRKGLVAGEFRHVGKITLRE